MRTYIDSVKKERAAYPEESTAYFENVVNITADVHSVIPKDKQNGSE